MAQSQFGRYELKSELGRGGMATVYLAHDPRFKREVAIKVLPREFIHDPSFRARFDREAQTVAAFEHSAVVPVYDFGEEEGQPYFVMRYMAGGSLTERMQPGLLANGEICRILDRITPALDEAHARGMVHRDLKPGNILFDQFGDAYIGDFGIVKLAEGSSTLTGTGMIVGTPAYMSPEQADGVADLDGRSDLYSLGVIVFEMLTGTQPYRADTPMRVLVQHLNAPVPPVREFRTDLSPDFQRIINRVMAKQREDRYPTATELAADVRAVCSGTPVQVPTQTLLEAEATLLETDGYPPALGDTFVESSGWTPPPMSAQPVQPPIIQAPASAAPPRRGVPVWAWVGGGAAALLCLGGVGLGALSLLNQRPAATPTNPPPTEIVAQITQAPANTDAPAAEATSTPAPALPTSLPAITPTPRASLPPVQIHPYCAMDGESPVSVAGGQPVTLYWTWTAMTRDQVQDQIDAGRYEIMLDGRTINADRRGNIELDSTVGYYKVSWYADVGVLTTGEHTASRALSWSKQIFDGWNTFGPGGQIETEFDTCTILVR